MTHKEFIAFLGQFDEKSNEVKSRAEYCIDGLAGIVQQNSRLNPFHNSLFLFCGNKGDRLKALYWEGDGFCSSLQMIGEWECGHGMPGKLNTFLHRNSGGFLKDFQ